MGSRGKEIIKNLKENLFRRDMGAAAAFARFARATILFFSQIMVVLLVGAKRISQGPLHPTPRLPVRVVLKKRKVALSRHPRGSYILFTTPHKNRLRENFSVLHTVQKSYSAATGREVVS